MKNALKKVASLFFLMCCLVCFFPIHALAYDDYYTYDLQRTDEYNNWIVWWNWSHNDLRTPIMDELAAIKNNGVTANVNTQEIKDSIDVAGELETFYEEKEKEGSTEVEKTPINYAHTKRDLANEMWSAVGAALNAGGDLTDEAVDKPGKTGLAKYMNLGVKLDDLDQQDVYKKIIAVMRTIAYSIAILFFSVNLIETTVKYEIVSMRGFASVFGRMIFSKIIIDSAATICMKIIGTTQWMISQVNAQMNITAKAAFSDTSISSSTSKLWVIGKIIDFFNSTANALPLLIMALVVLIVSMLILGKLMIRSIQLAMMISVSPVFFACACADVTKQYFKNFLTGFLQCALQIVFMVIVFWIGCGVLNGHAIGGDIFMEFKSTTMNAYRAIIVYIVMGIMIVKPPKFLTNAIN